MRARSFARVCACVGGENKENKNDGPDLTAVRDITKMDSRWLAVDKIVCVCVCARAHSRGGTEGGGGREIARTQARAREGEKTREGESARERQ